MPAAAAGGRGALPARLCGGLAGAECGGGMEGVCGPQHDNLHATCTLGGCTACGLGCTAVACRQRVQSPQSACVYLSGSASMMAAGGRATGSSAQRCALLYNLKWMGIVARGDMQKNCASFGCHAVMQCRLGPIITPSRSLTALALQCKAQKECSSAASSFSMFAPLARLVHVQISIHAKQRPARCQSLPTHHLT